MLQTPECFRFGAKPVEKTWIACCASVDYLRGEYTPESGMQHFVDDTHAAGTDAPFDAVLPIENVTRREARGVVHRGGVHNSRRQIRHRRSLDEVGRLLVRGEHLSKLLPEVRIGPAVLVEKAGALRPFACQCIVEERLQPVPLFVGHCRT